MYGDLDAWGVGLSNFGLGPANNFFLSVLFVIPGMICTGAFRILLSFVYTRKRFMEEDRRKKWVEGEGVNEKLWACLLERGVLCAVCAGGNEVLSALAVE